MYIVHQKNSWFVHVENCPRKIWHGMAWFIKFLWWQFLRDKKITILHNVSDSIFSYKYSTFIIYILWFEYVLEIRFFLRTSEHTMQTKRKYWKGVLSVSFKSFKLKLNVWLREAAKMAVKPPPPPPRSLWPSEHFLSRSMLFFP